MKGITRGANWIINKVEIVYRWLKPGTLVHFRYRSGEEGVKKIIKISIDLHGADAQEARLVIDTREQEKNITCQTYGWITLPEDRCRVCTDRESGRDSFILQYT